MLLQKIFCDILTHWTHERIKQIFCTTPQVHVVRQLRVENWYIGDWTGQTNRQWSIQSPRIESYVLDTFSKHNYNKINIVT